MKARKSWILAGILLMVGALVTASPSFAKSTKTPIDLWWVHCLVDLGIEWVSGDQILHGRGRIEEVVLYAYDPETLAGEIVGSAVTVGNANIELATGDGRLFGATSLIYLPVSATGTFDGRYQGSLTGWGSVSGRGVLQGTGEARGLKMKLNFETEPWPSWLEEELPTACPADKPLVGIFHNTGFVHDRHGG